ncbi:MAG TPA: type II toxin-antitoxin system RelE/ParE family toxin [Pseudomonadales bacterium]|nr:type II toxin-antitoxin system RelE/ParE family toxin [Pseudomonadales bacterium]HMW15568.1 type II toxin-antitoxin system RelE/ParE family toxin [Pseudomonadales bacterium]HMW83935.1 type II toxin-antitoxin system RelE/ParE family toxin [Pseudomonadales bacterium]HMY97804.1 type II toxin-antitoxin system RelE/ParE family toxin [Pseudomonadales bacterium]HMZ71451.1 type II toxin-antitoxin system RelE/ParE family toxin [Pseudomonadales bacterium]
MIYTARALADLDRLTDFLVEADPESAVQTVGLITEAMQVLANHPLIGRPAEQALRELVISRGKSGYLALYSHEVEQDIVLVLAIRHQREAGHVPE